MAGQDYAHRGLHGAGRVENSLGAFEDALARGYGIECDVRRASDGRAMVFHDADLARLTDETGLVAARDSKALGAIRFSGSGETIPSLREVLTLIGGRTPILIELKASREERIAALCLSVRRVLEGYTGPHAVMSFDPRVARWFYRHSPHTVRGLVVTEDEDKALPGHLRRQFALWHGRPDFLAYDIRDLPSRFAAAQRRRGLCVLTWTVRTPQHLERARAHADAAIAEGDGFGGAAA
ncbi:glycerophosphodiester phosphodiesterase family protein [Novosphingobium sp. PC22D]|uniref:glycerophosphodiester phosphodiesterase family protein n=1 Tax=Novosphingobium sp. PC22D TaxID=1962403 RepID=UPI001F0B2885|nr:glycerophosphodiester phosphodiesterase family protein [Novosphingobium sp. PC22D]